MIFVKEIQHPEAFVEDEEGKVFRIPIKEVSGCLTNTSILEQQEDGIYKVITNNQNEDCPGGACPAR